MVVRGCVAVAISLGFPSSNVAKGNELGLFDGAFVGRVNGAPQSIAAIRVADFLE